MSIRLKVPVILLAVFLLFLSFCIFLWNAGRDGSDKFPPLPERMEQFLCAPDAGLFLEGISDEEALLWKKKAQKDVPEAQFLYAKCLFYGAHFEESKEQAFAYFRKAAEKGLAEAELELGLFYFKGICVSRDYNEALKWYGRAAEKKERKS